MASKFKTKVTGTKYSCEIHHDEKHDKWTLALTIGDAIDRSTKLKNLSLRTIKEGVDELLDEFRNILNPFQFEMISKELYKQATGDEDLEKHKESIQHTKQMEKMMQDRGFQNALVSEYRDSFNVEKPAPAKQENDKEQKPEYKVPEKAPKPEEIADKSELKTMVSEFKDKYEETSGKQTTSDKSTQEPTPVKQEAPKMADENQFKLTSKDFNRLLNEINESKNQLKIEIKRLTNRMIKLDELIKNLSKYKA